MKSELDVKRANTLGLFYFKYLGFKLEKGSDMKKLKII